VVAVSFIFEYKEGGSSVTGIESDLRSFGPFLKLFQNDKRSIEHYRKHLREGGRDFTHISLHPPSVTTFGQSETVR